MKIEQPVMMKIEKIVNEAENVKTFIFKHQLKAKPGQFVIVWLPRINEKPMSISYQDNEKFGITVHAVGQFTKKMHGKTGTRFN